LALELRHQLWENGIEGYLAEEERQYTKQIRDKILHELESSDFIVVIYTKNGKKSSSVGQEIGFAHGKNIEMIIIAEEGVDLDDLITFGREPEKLSNDFADNCSNVIAFLRKQYNPRKPTPVLMKQIKKGKFLKLVHGDITETNTDVIVNAANSYLKNAGGVAAQIERKAGHRLRDKFTQEAWLDAYEDVYRSAIAKRRGSD